MNTAVGLAQFEEVGLQKTVKVGKSFDITLATVSASPAENRHLQWTKTAASPSMA